MKNLSKFLLTTALPFALSTGCSAQGKSLSFDFEPAFTAITQPGSTHVGPTTLFSAEQPLGWARNNSVDRAHDRDTPDSPFYFQRKDHPLYSLVRDGITIVGENTFTAQVPNGSYRATMYVGDFSPGETRPNLFATINGQAILTDDTAPGGFVKAFSFPLTVSDGKIVLVVEGRGLQKYFPLNGLVLEPAPDAPFKVTSSTLPEKQPTAQDYAQGWTRFVEALREDWNTAKADLKLAGLWSESWPAQRQALKKEKDHRTVFASGAMRYDEVANRAGGKIDLHEFSAIIREIGVDGLLGNSKQLHEQLPQEGLMAALGGPGFEMLPAGALSEADYNRILDRKTGEVTVLDKAYTPTSPAALAFIRDQYQKMFVPVPPKAHHLAIDEIRGLFSAGTVMGDYSEHTARAFADWARSRNIRLASQELPRPSRSMDFYHFYRFRQGVVPRFARQMVKDTPLEQLPFYLGNGYLGPETANHNSLWGPEAVREGFGIASWDYEGNKGSAEFLAAVEREHNGHVQNWTAFYGSGPTQGLVDAAVIASAATKEFSIWHQGSFIQSGSRVEWMKTAYLATRLAQAISNVSHDTNVYLYAPDSLVFNDLVGDLPRGESHRWKQMTTDLGKGNVDFKVTHTLQVPQNSLVVYAPERAVLNTEEAAALTRYVRGGGNLLFASDSLPETPDAKPLRELRAALEGKNVLRVATAPDAAVVRRFATEKKVTINPATNAPGVRSFAFSRGGQQMLLLTNTDIKQAVKVQIEQDGFTDYFSNKKIGKGTLEIPAGHYSLLKR